VLAVGLANRESRSSWRDFLLGLKARGLHGVEFVVADDHAGLRAALREVLAEAAYQRCYVHFLRNALDYVPRRSTTTACRSCAGSMTGATPTEAGAHPLSHEAFETEPLGIRFARDSPLGESGFEPLVPLTTDTRFRYRISPPARGETDGSNLLSSASESAYHTSTKC